MEIGSVQNTNSGNKVFQRKRDFSFRHYIV